MQNNGATNTTIEPTPEIAIKCYALPCAYNSSYQCTAQNIQISGASNYNAQNGTQCSTFRTK